MIIFLLELKFFFVCNFESNDYELINILYQFIKYYFILILENLDNLYIFAIKFFKFLLNIIFSFFIKIKVLISHFIVKFQFKKQSLVLKHLFKAKGLSEYFGAFFAKPTLYRFFSLYISFLWLFINLDWSEHFTESIDKTTGGGEFESDFEEAFTWEEDPLIGRNFFFLGQRLSSERTSEQPDLYKSNDIFLQSKKSKFNIYNREFLGGPVYLNVIDLFSLHEVFHQLGAYEFFGSSFISMNVSYETDFEFDFLFLSKFFHFFKYFFNNIYNNFFTFENSTKIFNYIIDILLYIVSFFFLLFKYVYIIIKK